MQCDFFAFEVKSVVLPNKKLLKKPNEGFINKLLLTNYLLKD
jgi:hypothetical protein